MGLSRLLLVVPSVMSYNAFLRELSAALVEKGVEVHCACSARAFVGQEGIPKPLLWHELSFPRGANLLAHVRSSLRLNRLVASIQPDLVHAHFSAAILTTALARRQSWNATIGTFQGISFPLVTGRIKAGLLRTAEAWSAQRLDSVWVLTEDDSRALQKASPRARVHQQPGYGFGCDLERFDPRQIREGDRHNLLMELGLSTQDRIFAFIGRFVNFKGFDLTIRSFLLLQHSAPEARLLLVGTRDPLHPTGLTPAEELVWQHCPQIIDVGWRTDVARYLAVADVVVFPSQREGVPVSLMEALSMGVPAITMNARGCREVVRDQQDGLVLNQARVESLAQAMCQLAKDDALRKALSAQALAGRDRFSRQQYVDTQIALYESVLTRQRPLHA